MEFEKLGKLLLKHKYLYYIECRPIISDYQYDMLEVKYIEMAKTIEEEPEFHLFYDWQDKQSILVDFPFNHPWAKVYI